jgi:hypothetical protein
MIFHCWPCPNVDEGLHFQEKNKGAIHSKKTRYWCRIFWMYYARCIPGSNRVGSGPLEPLDPFPSFFFSRIKVVDFRVYLWIKAFLFDRKGFKAILVHDKRLFRWFDRSEFTLLRVFRFHPHYEPASAPRNTPVQSSETKRAFYLVWTMRRLPFTLHSGFPMHCMVLLFLLP